jgi:hypothetical protein
MRRVRRTYGYKRDNGRRRARDKDKNEIISRLISMGILH